MPNGPWTAYSGGFQNGMTLAITPKNVVLRDNSLKPLLQCINYVILKIFKIETFWSTLMAKFMLLGVIGMCFIHFMQNFCFLGGHAFWLTQKSWNVPANHHPLFLSFFSGKSYHSVIAYVPSDENSNLLDNDMSRTNNWFGNPGSSGRLRWFLCGPCRATGHTCPIGSRHKLWSRLYLWH